MYKIKMKKAFTLIEMMIVVMILSILLGIMGFMSWKYILDLNLENDKETILNTFFETQTISLSQANFGKKGNISYIGVELTPNKSYLNQVAITGNLQNSRIFTVGIKTLSYFKLGTGIYLYSGTNLEKKISNSSYIFYKPYTIGAVFIENNNIYTGNYTIKFKADFRGQKQCFGLNLLVGKLVGEDCDF